MLFAFFLVGRVPNHTFRKLAYSSLFKMRIGAGASVHWRLVAYQPPGITIGRNAIIGNDCFIDGRNGVSIGSNVNIGGHTMIFTLQHDPNARDFGTKGGPVKIGSRAYIGSRSTILPGVTIGEGAVVAAGAVVSRDVPPFEIHAGVPARKIADRSREIDYELSFHLPFQ